MLGKLTHSDFTECKVKTSVIQYTEEVAMRVVFEPVNLKQQLFSSYVAVCCALL